MLEAVGRFLTGSSLNEMRRRFLQNGHPTCVVNYNGNNVLNRQRNSLAFHFSPSSRKNPSLRKLTCCTLCRMIRF